MNIQGNFLCLTTRLYEAATGHLIEIFWIQDKF